LTCEATVQIFLALRESVIRVWPERQGDVTLAAIEEHGNEFLVGGAELVELLESIAVQGLRRYGFHEAADLRFGYTSNEVGFGWTNAAFLQISDDLLLGTP
jgi:hypothetical protein